MFTLPTSTFSMTPKFPTILEVPGYEAVDFMRLAEPYFWSKLWHISALRAEEWLHHYDGPSEEQCKELELEPYWKAWTENAQHLDIRASTKLDDFF